METSTAPRLAARWALRLPLAGAAAALACLGAGHPAHATSLHHAALMIQHSGGGVLVRCIAFVEDQISGFQLIERSRVEYQAQPYGSLGNAICQLDSEPNPVPGNCWGTGAYWQYFHRSGNQWVSSRAGAASATLHDGDMDGWRYAAGPGAPANLSFSSVCGSPAAPAATLAATRTARPQPAAVVPIPSTPGSLSVTPSPAPSPSLEALATPATATPPSTLAATGPPQHPPPSSSGAWLLLIGGSVVLAAVGTVNLLRRGP